MAEPRCTIQRPFVAKKGLFIAEFLLENGADVNASTIGGRSTLQEALSNHELEDKEELVALLVAHGANVGVLDRADRETVKRWRAGGSSGARR
jgi:ankyrin repeat protein